MVADHSRTAERESSGGDDPLGGTSGDGDKGAETPSDVPPLEEEEPVRSSFDQALLMESIDELERRSSPHRAASFGNAGFGERPASAAASAAAFIADVPGADGAVQDDTADSVLPSLSGGGMDRSSHGSGHGSRRCSEHSGRRVAIAKEKVHERVFGVSEESESATGDELSSRGGGKREEPSSENEGLIKSEELPSNHMTGGPSTEDLPPLEGDVTKSDDRNGAVLVNLDTPPKESAEENTKESVDRVEEPFLSIPSPSNDSDRTAATTSPPPEAKRGGGNIDAAANPDQEVDWKKVVAEESAEESNGIAFNREKASSLQDRPTSPRRSQCTGEVDAAKASSPVGGTASDDGANGETSVEEMYEEKNSPSPAPSDNTNAGGGDNRDDTTTVMATKAENVEEAIKQHASNRDEACFSEDSPKYEGRTSEECAPLQEETFPKESHAERAEGTKQLLLPARLPCMNEDNMVKSGSPFGGAVSGEEANQEAAVKERKDKESPSPVPSKEKSGDDDNQKDDTTSAAVAISHKNDVSKEETVPFVEEMEEIAFDRAGASSWSSSGDTPKSEDGAPRVRVARKANETPKGGQEEIVKKTEQPLDKDSTAKAQSSSLSELESKDEMAHSSTEENTVDEEKKSDGSSSLARLQDMNKGSDNHNRATKAGDSLHPPSSAEGGDSDESSHDSEFDEFMCIISKIPNKQISAEVVEGQPEVVQREADIDSSATTHVPGQADASDTGTTDAGGGGGSGTQCAPLKPRLRNNMSKLAMMFKNH